MKTPYCQIYKHTDVPLHRNSSNKYGAIYYMCRGCTTARLKKYRSTSEGKKKVYEAVLRSTKKHWEKQLARVKLGYQIKTGKIRRPETCKHCHKKKKVEGHHTDYSKPLEVDWLCRQCHVDADKQMRILSPMSPMTRPSEVLVLAN